MFIVLITLYFNYHTTGSICGIFANIQNISVISHLFANKIVGSRGVKNRDFCIGIITQIRDMLLWTD